MNTIATYMIQNFQPIYILYFALYIVAFVVCFVSTFALYAAVIMFRGIRDSGKLETLAPSVTMCIKIILYIGLALDAILNIVFLSVYFWELPKEILSTFRVKRWYWSTENTRNKRKAHWFADNYLLPIDPSHMDK